MNDLALGSDSLTCAKELVVLFGIRMACDAYGFLFNSRWMLMIFSFRGTYGHRAYNLFTVYVFFFFFAVLGTQVGCKE